MAFICGMVIGGMLGVTVAALCAVGRESESKADEGEQQD